MKIGSCMWPFVYDMCNHASIIGNENQLKQLLLNEKKEKYGKNILVEIVPYP
jgi:hypothetical protein